MAQTLRSPTARPAPGPRPPRNLKSSLRLVQPSCHDTGPDAGSRPDALTLALVGQPNVGKSTVFNMLTGLNQHVGNWPGKTVEQKIGTCTRGDVTLDLVD